MDRNQAPPVKAAGRTHVLNQDRDPVGPIRYSWRKPQENQDRQHQERAAPRDGIDRPANEANEEQDQGCDKAFGHGLLRRNPAAP
jgi:hypothetical protein